MLLAFHDDAAIKEEFMARVRKHQELDNFRQGFYWENGKGCAVGCTLEMDPNNHINSIHKEYEIQLGIPRILARLEDGIFEGLSIEDSKNWPLNFISSIRVGADLSNVWSKFAIWLLGDSKYGVINYAKNKKTKQIVQTVISFYENKENISIKQWKDAAAAASAAAASDAAASGTAAAYAVYAVYAASAASAEAVAASAVAAEAASAVAVAAASAVAAEAASAVAVAAASAVAAAAAYFKTKKQEIRKIQADTLLKLLQEA